MNNCTEGVCGMREGLVIRSVYYTLFIIPYRYTCSTNKATVGNYEMGCILFKKYVLGSSDADETSSCKQQVVLQDFQAFPNEINCTHALSVSE